MYLNKWDEFGMLLLCSPWVMYSLQTTFKHLHSIRWLHGVHMAGDLCSRSSLQPPHLEPVGRHPLRPTKELQHRRGVAQRLSQSCQLHSSNHLEVFGSPQTGTGGLWWQDLQPLHAGSSSSKTEEVDQSGWAAPGHHRPLRWLWAAQIFDCYWVFNRCLICWVYLLIICECILQLLLIYTIITYNFIRRSINLLSVFAYYMWMYTSIITYIYNYYL